MCENEWEVLNGKCGDIVNRAEACAASTDDRLVRPFGNIEVATAEVLLNLLERVDRLHQCSFIYNTTHGN